MKPSVNTPHSRNDTASLYKTKRSNESDEQINVQEDKAFSIDIYDKDISVPPFCSCCMKRCNRMVNISGKVGGKVKSGSVESQTNYHFPLCEECETHRKELKKKRNLIYGLSVLIGVLSMLLLMIILKPDDWVAVAIGAAMLVFLYFALYFGLKLQRLPMGHSSRFESVLFGAAETKQAPERGTEKNVLYQGAVQTGLQTFLFTNPQYAQVFCESNERKTSKPLEIVFRNSAPIRSIATLDRHKVSGFLRALVTYLLIAFIAFWLNMSYGVFRNISFEKEEILPEEGTIFGRVIDAVNGNPLSQVQISISNESNELISSLTSDEQGTYSVTFPAGSYHAIFSKDGYETASQIFLSVSGKQIENQDCALSPIIAEGHLRIVLQWGALPKDLDAHLINKDHNLHVFYKSLIAMQNGDKIAELELDDTDSYGPETLHILIPLTGKYVYCVHDYTNRNSNLSNKLAASGATVTVYLGDNKKQEFTVPDKPGTCWEVFSLENGIITPINEMSYISDETLVGQ